MRQCADVFATMVLLKVKNVGFVDTVDFVDVKMLAVPVFCISHAQIMYMAKEKSHETQRSTPFLLENP